MPETVRDVRVTLSTLTSLTLEWTPGYNGGEEQHFLVAYRKYPDDSFGSPEETNVPEYIVDNLEPGTTYEIAIVSENSVGKSDPVTVINRTKRTLFFFLE